jgi:hypothetical protein
VGPLAVSMLLEISLLKTFAFFRLQKAQPERRPYKGLYKGLCKDPAVEDSIMESSILEACALWHLEAAPVSTDEESH